MHQYNAKIASIPMPDRIKRLPISPTGFPVPYFVMWFNDKPDFRVVDPLKMRQCVYKKKCWICGDPLGRTFAMTIGPMCAVNRTVSEPPSHRECAIYAATACPFLANPRMRRNDTELGFDPIQPAGIEIRRNPGAVAVWCTREYHMQTVQAAPGVKPGVLFRFGDPTEVLWFANGRKATREEVDASIRTGLDEQLIPIALEEGSLEYVNRAVEALQKYLPTE